MQENSQGEEAYINNLKKNFFIKKKKEGNVNLSINCTWSTQNYQVVVSKFALQNYGDNGL